MIEIVEQQIVVEVTQVEPVQQLLLVEQADTQVLEVVIPGTKGEKGDTGDQGPQGPPGSGGSGSNWAYVHNQAIPSATWVITHSLGGFPNITVIDSSDREVVGDVVYTDLNTITVTFAAAFSGKAYLS